MKHRTIVYLSLYLAVFMLFLAGCFLRARPATVQPDPQCLVVEREFGPNYIADEYIGDCPDKPD